MLPDLLPEKDAGGEYVAQYKYNGDHLVWWVNPATKEVGVWGREAKPIARFDLTPAIKDQFLSLNLNPVWQYWFAGELLKNHTPSVGYKNRIVLFDFLQAGKILFVTTPNQMGRLAALSTACRNPQKFESKNGIALVVTDNIWLAPTFDDSFEAHFQEHIALPEIEGLMLRRRNAVLGRLCTSYWETSDLIRVRKPHSGGAYLF
jgi:hypothetical protein